MAAEPEHDLGAARTLEAEAIGAPGQRTFRIRISTAQSAASLWLEKEQVSALATAIQQVLARRPQEGASRRPGAPALQPFPDRPDYDFRVSQLALGYDEDADSIVILATDAAAADQGRPTLRATVSRETAQLFTAQTDVTLKAGRPLCPLCQTPLEGESHFCPPSNGHSTDALAWLRPPEG